MGVRIDAASFDHASPLRERVLCRSSVEPFLALHPGLMRPVLVRTCLPALAALEEGVDHPVMGCAENDDAVVPRQLKTASRERVDVMNVQRSATLPGNPGEVALSVFENACAEVAPGLCVVQRWHMRSLLDTVPHPMDSKPVFHSAFPKFLHEICTSIRSVGD